MYAMTTPALLEFIQFFEQLPLSLPLHRAHIARNGPELAEILEFADCTIPLAVKLGLVSLGWSSGESGGVGG